MFEKNFIKVIDNFLPQITFQRIKDNILDHGFNWSYSEKDYNPDLEKSSGKKIEDNVGCPMYVHSLYGSKQVLSPFFPMFLPIFDVLKEKFKESYGGLIKAKINAYSNHGQRKNLAKHNDLYFMPNMLDKEHLIREEDKIFCTCVWQLTTDNGATCIGEKEFKNKENTLIAFDGSMEHWAYSQTDIDRRIIMNINFKIGKQTGEYPW
jgi:hypothetical protein